MSDDEDLPTSKLKKSDEPNIDPESGYSKSFKNKMGNRRSHNILLTLVIFLFAVLLLAVLGLSYVYLAAVNQEKQLCTTEDCLRSATLFVESMNKSVDPCEDFYQFACGNYGNNHRIPKTSYLNDRFSELQDTLTVLIRDFMEQDDSTNESYSVIQSKLLYHSCMATDEMDVAGLQPLLDLLDKIGLPYLEFTTKNTRKKYSNFSQTIARVHKYLSLEYLFAINVEPNPKNRTVNRISLSKPTGSVVFPAYKITEKMEKMNSRKMRETIATEEKVENDNDSVENEETINYIKAFAKYIKDVWMEIFKSQSDYSNDVINQFYNRIGNMLLFKNELANITNQVYDTDSDLPSVMTIHELQSWTDNITKITFNMHERLIDWEQYFTVVFADLDDITLDFKTDLIQIKNIEFFEAFFKILEKYGKSQVLTNVWWEVVSTIIPYTTNRMRNIQDRYYYQTTGLENNPSRSLYCANTVNLMMGMAVANVFQNHKPLDRGKQMIVEMLSNIHWAFEQIVKGLKWMDNTTKQRTLYKTKEMKILIGYPEFINDTEALDMYYSEFVINKTDFFGNVMRYVQLSVHENLLELRSLNNYTTNMWASDPLDVNAYYLNQANTITVPAGILRFPFFGHDLQVLNYGYLGTILGHELTHGFDNTGRRFNYDGNENMWWTNKTTEEYDKRGECFVNQYESYLVPLINEKVNGKLTLDENIADNGGLREAFWAYRKYVTDHGEELKLPGLEDYNNEQIYYLAFANNWCETTTLEGLLNSLSDEHSPNYIRVIGALANSREFSEVWKCEKGTKMNPNIEKCKLW